MEDEIEVLDKAIAQMEDNEVSDGLVNNLHGQLVGDRHITDVWKPAKDSLIQAGYDDVDVRITIEPETDAGPGYHYTMECDVVEFDEDAMEYRTRSFWSRWDGTIREFTDCPFTSIYTNNKQTRTLELIVDVDDLSEGLPSDFTEMVNRRDYLSITDIGPICEDNIHVTVEVDNV